ncbi:MAG: molybdopterin biosynthesis protein [Firmicutes bacterium]|nr:molybdopterin biosynthesis protein [Bacillota bacterium]
MTKRNLYLKTTPVEEALDKYILAIDDSTAFDLEIETVSTYDALGRITAEAIFAKCSSPMFNAAAMDGVAVVASQTKYATEREPLQLTLDKDYKIVDTGDPIKSPYDAVIMAEDVIEVDDEHIKIMESVPGWQHVRPIGEDIVAGEMILPSSHEIRAVDIGVLLAGGILEILVLAKPRVGIIPTGTEIIKPYDNPKEGDIIDSNSGMFAGLATEQGCLPKIYDIVPDIYDKIKETVSKSLEENDIVVVNAGSSAGTEDYTASILAEMGQVIIHGVAMKPGKPVILAIVQGKPVIGLPGYPVSAYLAFDTFVTPVINKMLKASAKSKNVVKATLAKRLISSLKHREYVRVKVGYVGGKLVASPLARGAGAAMSLVKADGFCIIPQNSEGIEAGEEVEIVLCKSPEEIENTLVSIGSHDMTLDIIGDMMANKYPGMRFTSTHVGSMAGLMALQRHETTIAPTHLLDMETGEYNVSYLKQIFPGEEMALIKGLDRIQGIMVKKGNPLAIKGVEDLVRARYVNRQRGAGTRVLLDYKLKQAGISPSQIDGYDKEAATHMAVAAAVSSDEIDAGMGIKPAADAMGLDFIEVGVEEYDFAIRKEDLDNPKVKALIEILKSETFHTRLDEMGGYGYHQTGKIIQI